MRSKLDFIVSIVMEEFIFLEELVNKSIYEFRYCVKEVEIVEYFVFL